MLKNTILVITLFVFSTGYAQAADLAKLVQERISHDGKTLDLKGLNIGPKGAKKLAAMESLASVVTLQLQGNNIKARGMKALAKSSANSRRRDSSKTRFCSS